MPKAGSARCMQSSRQCRPDRRFNPNRTFLICELRYVPGVGPLSTLVSQAVVAHKKTGRYGRQPSSEIAFDHLHRFGERRFVFLFGSEHHDWFAVTEDETKKPAQRADRRENLGVEHYLGQQKHLGEQVHQGADHGEGQSEVPARERERALR